MEDETETKAHYIGETGEGSLLEQTVALVDQRRRSDILKIDDIANLIEPARVELGPEGGAEIIPAGDFDSYRSKPLYRDGTADLGSLDSLILFTKRYKGADSVVFADDNRTNPSIVSVLDYHPSGPEGAAFGRFGARHNLPLSDEWQAWAKWNGETITMPNFARFLEDHIVDVLPPGMVELSEEQQRFVDALGGDHRIADPAKLMELATGLRVFEDSEVSQATNLQSGEGQLILTNTHTDGAGGKLIIPSMFVIAVPVFRHGERYQIIVRLRYRRTSSGIVFIYELWRDDLVFDHAFNEASRRVDEETEVPVFRGTRGDS